MYIHILSHDNLYILYCHLPSPGVMKVTNYNILSLSDLFLEVEKKIFEEIMHFHYMTYMVRPQHKNPRPVGHEINNFSIHFLGHHYYILSLFDLYA